MTSTVEPRLYTWISEKGRVIEQVRVVVRGDRWRARGQIVAASDSQFGHPAFSAVYEVDVDDDLAIRRLGLTTSTLDGERSLELVRDADGAWLMSDQAGTRTRVGEPGVLDVDVTLSVFFAGLMIRRHALHEQQAEMTGPALTIDAVTHALADDTVTMHSDTDRVHGLTATASTSASVDVDGVIVDVLGLTKRV